jgi:hypothetical protein
MKLFAKAVLIFLAHLKYPESISGKLANFCISIAAAQVARGITPMSVRLL